MPYLLTSTANPGSPTSWVKMDTESVLSGHSEYSPRIHNGCPPAASINVRQRPLPPIGPLKGNYSSAIQPSSFGMNGGGTSLANLGNLSSLGVATSNNGGLFQSSPTSVLSNYSLNRNLNHLNLNLVPRTNSVLSNNIGNNPYRVDLESPPYQTAASLPPLHETLRDRHEKIEVQILPQDNDWGDNTTAVTGLSDLAFPPDSMGKWGEDVTSNDFDYEGWRFTCQRYMGTWTASALSILAFFSPILMLILPQLEFVGLSDRQKKCEVECDGLLISFSFKLLILLFGSWALFFRQPKATMPRIHLFRACVCTLLFVFVFAFWLFYGVRVFDEQKRRVQYHDIVQYASSMVDALLFVHYLALILMEIKHLTPQFYIKIVRSPDGDSRSYAIGQMSIQRAAVWVLEKYYTDFSIYNPYLEQLPNYSPVTPRMTGNGKPYMQFTASAFSNGGSRAQQNNFKYYDVDGLGTIHEKDNNRLSSPGMSRKRESSHNEKIQEEFEYERRLKKRRSRLVSATEDAFAHLKRVSQERIKAPSSPMDCYEAAQSIFPSIAKPLQKFLRITRQQPRHTMDSILQHLSTCLKFDMSPRAFLERYLVSSPVLQNDREHKPVQSWALICDTLLSRNVKAGTLFQMRQGNDVSLLCEVHPLPHLNISEEVIDPRSNRFLLRLNSETPV